MRHLLKRTMSVLMAFVLLLAIVPFSVFSDSEILSIFDEKIFNTEAYAASSGTCGEKLIWTVNNGTLTISGTGRMTDFLFSIGESPNYPWNTSGIKRIVVSEGVTHIGSNAFMYMSEVTEVKLPSTLKSIGVYSFACCTDLTKLYLPEKLTEIGYNAFYCCTALETVEFPETLTLIGSSAFECCNSLKKIEFSGGKVKVGEYAFSSCVSLTEVFIPAEVEFVNFSGFSNSMPVLSVFSDCTSLNNITVDKNNKKLSSENGVLFDKNKTTLMCYPAAKSDIFYRIPKTVKKISENAFRQCKAIKYINIPSGVKEIGSWAFLGCSSLVAVNLPDGIRVLSDYLFANCSSLSYVNIPSGVETIDYSVFYGCTSLHTLYIPKSVTSISNSFNYRTIKDIYYEGSISEWNNVIDSLAADRIENATIHYNHSFDKDDVFASGTCGDSVLWSLDNKGVLTISGNGNMKDYNYSDDVPWYKYRFNVREIVVKKGVTSIGNRAFDGCVFSSSVSFPDGVFYIGQSAFSKCMSISVFDLPDGLSMIGNGAFEECCSIKEIYLPLSVTSVGFYGELYDITDIYYAGSETNWKENVSGSFGENGKLHFNFSYKLGYIDEDNTVSAADARIVLRASVGLEDLTAKQKKAADVNRDLIISAADARLILRVSVGLEKLN